MRRVRWCTVDGVIDFAGQVCWADQTNGKLSTALERSEEAGVRCVLDPARKRDPRCPLTHLLPYQAETVCNRIWVRSALFLDR